MNVPYPAGPQKLPAGLTSPNRSYKRSVWLAVLALGAFVGLYFGLTGWLAYKTYGFLAAAIGGGTGMVDAWIAAVPSLFLLLFLLKALFFRDKAAPRRAFPVTPAEEPALFEFLNRVADEAGAPRPHKVFLSPEVNAAVFYDVSVLNLLFPSRKNLKIGLGLVNVLSLSEFKAVLAHEFGHFGQRAMAVGSWVYTAQRIAAHIVAKRDVMDRFLVGISRLDFRIAWIGYAMRIVVWSLRSVVDTVFSVAVLAERALTRKMEFQADLVAVSLTGSDAIVHALHRLGPADEAFDQAAEILVGERLEGRAVGDVYLLQTHMVERLRTLLGDRRYGAPPPVPEDAAERHRVFEKHMASPPRMWSTHPPNEEREENAKRIYVAAPHDARPAWELFRDPDEVRRRMTAFLLEAVVSDPDAPEGIRDSAQPTGTVDGLAAVATRFNRIFFDSMYRGTYLKRSVVRVARRSDELFPQAFPAREDWETPYSDAMVDAIARQKSLEEEYDTLLGLQRGLLQAGTGRIQFRGRVLRRKELPRALALLKAERDESRREVAEHDRRARGIHLAAAESIGQGWPEYLRGAVALLHYADHTEADLKDAAASFRNVLAVVTADGRVSQREAERLVAEGTMLHHAMESVQAAAPDVVLPESVCKRFEVTSWKEVLPRGLGLAPPSTNLLGEWCEAVGGWLSGYAGPLDVLERFSLEHLLECERRVMRMARGEEPVQPAPAAARVPRTYYTLPPGNEREKQWKLGWWDRFQIADGFAPTVVRFAVAGSVVGLAVWAATSLDSVTIDIHNGLGRPLTVRLGATAMLVDAHESRSTVIPYASALKVVTSTAAGQVVEQFSAPLPQSMATYVYNVAGADALVRWTAVYGHVAAPPERRLGAPRWAPTDATFRFQDPPRSGKGGTTYPVLSAPVRGPELMLNLVERSEERQAMVEAHARWDLPDQRETIEWIERAAELPGGEAIAAHRLELDPDDILGHRLIQESTKGERHRALCDGYLARSRSVPSEPTLAYLAIRCMEDGPEQDQAFIRAYRANPDHAWLAYAAGHALASLGKWQEALAVFERHCTNAGLPEQMVLDTARLLRLVNRPADARRLRGWSPMLENYLELEDATPKEGMGAAYAALVKGDLQEALERAAGKPQEARVLRLVAASSDAPDEAVRDALKLSPEAGIDIHTLWPAIGLALRHRASIAELKKAIPAHVQPAFQEQMQRCVDRVAAGVRPAAMDELLRGVPLVHRAHVLVMAVVALGDRAPEAWRETALQLLFAPERPSL